jgi:hypothetical protein
MRRMGLSCGVELIDSGSAPIYIQVSAKTDPDRRWRRCLSIRRRNLNNIEGRRTVRARVPRKIPLCIRAQQVSGAQMTLRSTHSIQVQLSVRPPAALTRTF